MDTLEGSQPAAAEVSRWTDICGFIDGKPGQVYVTYQKAGTRLYSDQREVTLEEWEALVAGKESA